MQSPTNDPTVSQKFVLMRKVRGATKEASGKVGEGRGGKAEMIWIREEPVPGLVRRTYIWLRTGCGLQEKDEEHWLRGMRGQIALLLLGGRALEIGGVVFSIALRMHRVWDAH
jgi:hypothetical protein